MGTRGDLDAAYALLSSPPGAPGSGRLRYGAAMTLYQAGSIGAEVLEVYRSCAGLDGQDALALLAEYGLPNPTGLRQAGGAIGTLLEQIDHYLSGLPGPGIAEVRSGLAAARGGAIAQVASGENPVVSSHLDAALRAAAVTVPRLADAIRMAAPDLNWVTYDGYDPKLIGSDFMQGHAFATIIGGDAPIRAQDFDLGLFLIAPHVLYRDHCHAAPELYAPLTGPHGWRFGVAAPLQIKPAHLPIWNDPFAPHLTKVGPVPFLCLFGWTRDVEAVATVIPATDWATLEAMRLGESDA